MIDVPGFECFSHVAEKPHRVLVVQSNVVHYSDRLLGDHIPERLAGIDTPELKGDCAAERALVIQARDFLVARLATAVRVDLHSPARDTYFRLNGRLLAEGQNLSRDLITTKLARLYAGGKKLPFC